MVCAGVLGSWRKVRTGGRAACLLLLMRLHNHLQQLQSPKFLIIMTETGAMSADTSPKSQFRCLVCGWES